MFLISWKDYRSRRGVENRHCHGNQGRLNCEPKIGAGSIRHVVLRRIACSVRARGARMKRKSDFRIHGTLKYASVVVHCTERMLPWCVFRE